MPDITVSTEGVAKLLRDDFKPNRWLTGGSVQASIVLYNDNYPEQDGTTDQPRVGFWSRPLEN